MTPHRNAEDVSGAMFGSFEDMNRLGNHPIPLVLMDRFEANPRWSRGTDPRISSVWSYRQRFPRGLHEQLDLEDVFTLVLAGSFDGLPCNPRS